MLDSKAFYLGLHCDSVTAHIMGTLYNVQRVKVFTCCNYSLFLCFYSINLVFS